MDVHAVIRTFKLELSTTPPLNESECRQQHSFKNRTGPAGPTGSIGNRPPIRAGYINKPKIMKNP